ncbi:MAG: acid phosphatase, partial [Acidimicrobiaceae bacterium]|nr:acid phosphatase [Acidimicrobiaceae bacterium]
AARSGVPAFRHLFVVVMENLGYGSAMATPGLTSLASRYGLATDYYAVSHPSLPNYIGLTSGSTWGITSDCTTCYVGAPNLFSQLSAAHVSYDAYIQGIPSSCYLNSYGGVDYAGKHDPFMYYDNVRSSRSLCSHIQPYPALSGLLSGPASKVPAFVWVTPNLCNDGHDCPASSAAAWLTSYVASVTRSAAWHDGGALIVTWDESEGGDNAAVTSSGHVVSSGGGGRVMTLVVAPGVHAGTRVATPYSHYSLLATVEDAFGLPLLGNAKSATPLSAFFRGAK